MRLLAFSLAITTASFLAACGGTVIHGSGGSTGTGASTTSTGAGTTTSTGASTTGTGASTTSTTSTTGTGGESPVGDCHTDADCAGGTCAPLTPGGYLVCLHVPAAATSCNTPMSQQDQCCKSADCKDGQACYSSQDLVQCAGGPAMQIYNLCVSDQCTSDADCAGGSAPRICAPAGAFNSPVRACFTAYCHTSADCTAQPGGACVPVSQPCCAYPGGLACVYPGGCRKDSDCSQGDTCKIDPMKGAGVCMSGPFPCPV